MHLKAFLVVLFTFFAQLFLPSSAIAAPDPVLTLSSPSEQLINTSVAIDFTFVNGSATPGETGYFPMAEVILPPELSCGGCSVVATDPAGAPITVTEFGGYGVGGATYQNPVTGEDITLNDDETLLVLGKPSGSFSVGQPQVAGTITATMTADAVVGTPFTVSGRGIFAAGDSPDGTPGPCGGPDDTICQSPSVTTNTTPTVILFEKTTGGIPVTGPNFPRSFSITADVATGETVDNVIITDVLPDELIFTDGGTCETTFTFSVAPDNCIYSIDADGGGSFIATFNSVVGANGVDITITFSGYVQEFDDNDGVTPIIDPSTGNPTSSTNTANLNYDYDSNPLSDSDDATITQRSVSITKNGNVAAPGANGISPGDVIDWTVTVYVSDYFEFDDNDFFDTIGDGQTYVTDSFKVRVVEGNVDQTLNATQTDESVFAPYLTFPGGGGVGETQIAFDLSEAMANVFTGLDETLSGDDVFATGNQTRVIIEYQTTISEEYVEDPPGGDPNNTSIIGASDIVSNTGQIVFQVAGTANDQDINDSSDITIAPITTFTKTIAFIRDGDSGTVTPNPTPPILIKEGDEVTYRIDVTIPTGDVENLTIRDYLPDPLFNVNDPDADGSNETFTKLADGDTRPSPAEWRFTTASDIAPAGETLDADPEGNDDNSFEIAFDDSDTELDSSSNTRVVSFMFTVTATDEPYTNGLNLINLIYLTYANSQSEVIVETLSAIVAITTQSPDLEVTKFANAVITGNGSDNGQTDFTGVDSGDTLEFGVTIENVGDNEAFDVELTDVLPAGLTRVSLATPTGTGCDVTSFSDDSSGNTVAFSGVEIDVGSTCTVTYRVTVDETALFDQTLTNTATVLFASAPGGPDFAPESDEADTTLESPSITKTYQLGTSSDPVTVDDELRPGETVDFTFAVTVPEGTANSFSVQEVDNGSGNPSSDFFFDLASGDVSFAATIEQDCSDPTANGAGHFNFDGLEDVCFTLDPSLPGNQSQVNTTTYRINFGTLTNYNTNDAVTETFSLTVNVEVQGNKTAGTYTNRAQTRWNNGASNQTRTGTDTFILANPVLDITKDSLTAGPVEIGDTIRFRVTVANTGDSPAYDIATLIDTLPTGTGNATLISATYDGSDITGQGGFGFTQVGQEVRVNIVNTSNDPDIADGDSFIVIYDVDVQGTQVDDTTAGPGHPNPGGVVDGPGCVDNIVNSADIASFETGDAGSGVTITAIAADSASVALDSDGDTVPNSVETLGETCTDSDGDGVQDHMDTDADDNGVGDSTEYNGGEDTEGDGTPNYRDLDDDGDSISDWDEIGDAGGSSGDTDGDGLVDWRDADSDNDGIPDSVECGAAMPCPDTDGDGLEDYRDVDADNDGIPDIVEAGGVDADGDGLPDDLTDTDGDGLVDLFDTDNGGTPLANPDTDGDGLEDIIDLDSDNDGVPDITEAGGTDTDGNGIVDDPTDTDGDGLADETDTDDGGTALANPDTDGDGLDDSKDLDSDNDGIPDITEAGGTDTDGDGEPDDVTDTDGDGLVDLFDPDDGGTPLDNPDTDGDGLDDRIDLDSDSDGIPDITEAGGTDADGDGVVDTATDTDNDGLADIVDPDNGGTPLDDNDLDGDGLKDRLDLDADGDGIVDIVEAGGTDANGDGVLDDLTDTDGDGLADLVDDDNGGTPLTNPDSDTDGKFDFQDIDSDDDGITDNVEAQTTAGYEAPDGVDTDGDGIDDAYDPDNGGTALIPVNTDGVDNPDYLDTDTDNDGVLDEIEGHDANMDGVADVTPAGTDADGDGLDDNYDTVAAPGAGNSTGSNAPLQDSDGTEDKDWRDIDDDGDGINTIDEVPGDADGDGNPNYLDTDSDGDGILDEDEGGLEDTDGDSNKNYVDLDSDNDGIPDTAEGVGDDDGDGIPNYLDLDSDNDGIVDLVEAGGTDADGDGILDDTTDTDGDGLADLVDPDNGGTPLANPDSDSDGKRDIYDIDSDNDGIVDNIEGQPTIGYVAPSGTDANSNGIDDVYEGAGAIVPENTDGTDNPDYLDLDSDNDTVLDSIEGHDANKDGIADATPSGTDADDDGLDDAYDTVVSPGAGNVTGSNAPLQDSDSDLARDWRDIDDDGDGLPTTYERAQHAEDVDGDGTPNYLDLNSDGDAFTDMQECMAYPPCPDEDSDGRDDPYDPLACDLSGVFTLPNGEPIQGVTIEIDPGTQTDTTDVNGNFTLIDVEDGTYTLRALLPDGNGIGIETVTIVNGMCPFVEIPAEFFLKTPIYFVWNSYYRQQNFAGLMNTGDLPVNVTVTFYDNLGNVLHTVTNLVIPPKSEQDLSINALPGYDLDTYGFVKVEFDREGDFDGFSSYYRYDDDGFDDVGFSILKPFENVQLGNTYGLSNTMQPSIDPDDAGNNLPQWMQIVNLNPTDVKEFRVKVYNVAGEEVSNRSFFLPPFGRFDTQAGHEEPGAENLNLVEVIPTDASSPYLAQLYYYSADDPIATLADTFSFANGTTASLGGRFTQYVRVSTGSDAGNWLILANPGNATSTVNVVITDKSGAELSDQDYTIGAKQQLHLFMNEVLPAGSTGIAKIKSTDGTRVLAKAMAYFRDDSGSVTASYGSRGRPVLGGDYYSAHNSFFPLSFNWLRVQNVVDETVTVTAKVYDIAGNLIGTSIFDLDSDKGVDVDLETTLGIELADGSYGLIEVTSSVNGGIFADLLRVKYATDGTLDVDMAKPLPVR